MPVRTEVAETEAYAAMLSRMIAAYGRRLADGDPADLARAMTLQDLLGSVIAQGVADARATHGWSWSEIGEAAGISRQAAQQKYGRTVTA